MDWSNAFSVKRPSAKQQINDKEDNLSLEAIADDMTEEDEPSPMDEEGVDESSAEEATSDESVDEGGEEFTEDDVGSDDSSETEESSEENETVNDEGSGDEGEDEATDDDGEDEVEQDEESAEEPIDVGKLKISPLQEIDGKIELHRELKNLLYKVNKAIDAVSSCPSKKSVVVELRTLRSVVKKTIDGITVIQSKQLAFRYSMFIKTFESILDNIRRLSNERSDS